MRLFELGRGAKVSEGSAKKVGDEVDPTGILGVWVRWVGVGAGIGGERGGLAVSGLSSCEECSE